LILRFIDPVMSLPLIEVLWRHATRTKKLITRQLDAVLAYHRRGHGADSVLTST
jgi:hypothetical protein